MRSITAIDHMMTAAGFTLVRQSNHRVWRCPCGHAQITSHCSPCGGRGDQNMKAKLARTVRACNPKAQVKAA